MAAFKDDSDRSWLIHVDIPAIKLVRDQFAINLADIGEAPTYLTRLAEEPILLCDMLYVLCEEEARKREVSDTDFGKLLFGDTIDRATMALEEAITAFFPRKKRSVLQQLRAKIAKTREAGVDLVTAKLEDPKLDSRLKTMMATRMDAEIEKSLSTLSISATNSPESSESTPDD